MDQMLWKKALSVHGKELLETVANLNPVIKVEEGTEKEKINRYVAKKKHLLFQQAEHPNEYAWQKTSTLRMPVEIFRNCTLEERRGLFYKTLVRGSIMYLQVINEILPDNYKLLALAKHRDSMKLDDLSIVMYLPKLEPEMKHIKDGLHIRDYLRAALCSCSVNERKLFVTLDSNIIEDEAQRVCLGKITADELPSYVGKTDAKWKSYVGYLNSTPSFYHQNWLEEFMSIHIDVNVLHSSFKTWDRKKYPAHQYADQLKFRQAVKLSNMHYSKAVEKYEKGNIVDSFLCLNKALDLHPKNIEALIFRGTLYVSTGKFTNAFEDIEKVLKIDPGHKIARKHMAKLLIDASKVHLDQGDYDRAEESLKEALKLDRSKDAEKLLKFISKRKKGGGDPLKKTDKRHGNLDDLATSSPSRISRPPSSNSLHIKTEDSVGTKVPLSRHSSSSSVHSRTDEPTYKSPHHSRHLEPSEMKRHHDSEKRRHHRRDSEKRRHHHSFSRRKYSPQ